MNELPEPENKEDIICLCGSTKFKNSWIECSRKLVKKGWFVRSVEIWGHADNIPLSKEYKDYLEKIHKRKMKEADAIFVVDVDGYVGESTKNEIRWAKAHDMPIYYLDGGSENEKRII